MIKIARKGNGIKLFDESLTKLRKADIDSALRIAGRQIVDFVSVEVIATEGAANGRKWKPLSPEYAARKARKYPGRGILEATGLLSNSFRSKTQRMGTVNRLTVYNTVPYFVFHQSSAPRKSGLPRRATLVANARVREIVTKAIHKLYATNF